MKLIKSVFLAGLLLVVLAASAFTMYNRGGFDHIKVDSAKAQGLTDKLPPQLTSFFKRDDSTADQETSSSKKVVSFDRESAKEQMSVLTERSEEVSQHVTKVLGDFVKVNEENEKALHEQALEYGQYLYCQQVIEQYKEQNPEEVN